MLTGYTYQDYTMRWFFPEDPIYRRFAIAPELNNPADQNHQTDEDGPYSVADVLRASAVHSGHCASRNNRRRCSDSWPIANSGIRFGLTLISAYMYAMISSISGMRRATSAEAGGPAPSR